MIFTKQNTKLIYVYLINGYVYLSLTKMANSIETVVTITQYATIRFVLIDQI